MREWIAPFIAIVTSLGVVVGGVYGVGVWTASHEAQIISIVARLDTMDRDKANERVERRDSDNRIRDIIDRLQIVVTRLEAASEFKRRR